MLTIIALVALCFGIFFLTKYFSEKKKREEKKREEKKDFVVTAGISLGLFFLTPGIILFFIFLLLIAIVFGGCSGCG